MLASAPVVGVLALQGDFREHSAAVAACGATAVPIRRPAELASIDGLIIPGGESTTMDKLMRMFSLVEPLRQAMAEGLPVYGSCAGMILLADSLVDPALDREGNPQRTIGGLDMVVRRNAFGRQRESFEADLDFRGLASAVHAIFIRAPWVQSVGDSVEVLATVPAAATASLPGTDGIDRIVAVRSGNLLATSFHPEVTGERRIHELFIQMIARR